MISCYTKEAITCNHQINAFHFSKDEWNAKEDTGMSLKNALHVLQCAKRLEWKKINSCDESHLSIYMEVKCEWYGIT